LGSALTTCTPEKKTKPSKYDIMADVHKYRKFDAHAHVGLREGDADKQIEIADRLGIEKLYVSRPITNYSGKEPEDPAEVTRVNNLVLDAMKKYPDRYVGFVTVNPVYPKESLEEIDRCIDQGMVGYKGYTQVKINDPLYYPIIEKFIDLNMIMLMHAFLGLGVGGHRMKYEDKKVAPNTTIPDDMVDAAIKYPEVMLQYAHIGGGGDWEYACKMFRDYPNIYVDTSGSNNEEHMINFALNCVGEDRMFFWLRRKPLPGGWEDFAAELSDEQRRKIFSENFNNVLKKSGNNVA